MFTVWGVKVGNCDAVDAHTEREVYLVEDVVMHSTLTLCPKCLLAQTRLRSKGKKAEGGPDAGTARPATP